MNQELMCFLILNVKEKEEREVAGDLGKDKNDLLSGKEFESKIIPALSRDRGWDEWAAMEKWMEYDQERPGDGSDTFLLFLS